LQLNIHYHSLVVQGGWQKLADGRVVFQRIAPPRTDEVEALVVELAGRVERWLSRQGLGLQDAQPQVDDTDAQLGLQVASMAQRAALGTRAGRKTRRLMTLGGREFELPPRCAVYKGYNLHAGVGIGAHDRDGLERLCRYIARPPLARSRLERRNDGCLLLRLKRVWHDGTSAVVFEPVELISRLVALIPPARANGVSYHGVFAPAAKLRSAVVPVPSQDPWSWKKVCRHERHRDDSRWPPWARLLDRVFGVDAWACPRCGAQMELRALIIGPPATSRVVRGLSKAARGPPRPTAYFT